MAGRKRGDAPGDALARELKEARAQQAATAAILKIINRSPGDAQPVFDSIARQARRLLGGHSTAVLLVDGDLLRLAAITSTSKRGDAGLRRFFPLPIAQSVSDGLAIRRRAPICISDTEKHPRLSTRAVARMRGYRSNLVVPLIRGKEALGTISVTRREAGSFNAHEIKLLETFAGQAVIAIENVRSFNEAREALERQTATAEILSVIASSPADVQPVLDAIVRSAKWLVGGHTAAAHHLSDGKLHLSAFTSTTRAGDKALRAVWPAPLRNALAFARAVRSREPSVVEDTEKAHPRLRQVGRARGYRSMIVVPMLKKGTVIGTMSVTRRAPGTFDARQMSLLQTFADQAVIAIENVRLFNETKEALERQTATAEILKVIASSPADVQPVFDAIVQSAARLFRRKTALRVVEAGSLNRRAQSYETGREFHSPEVVPITRDNLVGRVILDGHAAQSADIRTDGTPYARAHADELSFRSIAAAPLIRDGVAIGTIAMSSPEPGALSEKQMELLATFADQAVIAIENVRLFNETKESLERQTATAEILKVIASSPSDVRPVFDAIAASAKRLLSGGAALVARRAGDMLHLAAFTSQGEAADAALQKLWPSKIVGQGHMGKAVLSGGPVLISDIEVEPGYSEGFKAMARTRGLRSIVSVPMLREGEAIGVISVNRPVAGRFSDHQTNLLRTFADQAVIAIENVRLFNETKESLERQTATAEILKVIASSPSDVQPVFDAVAASSARLCEASDAVVHLRQGDALRLAAHYGRQFSARPAGATTPLDRGWVMGRCALEGRQIHIHDLQAEVEDYPVGSANARERGFRTILATPLLREGKAIGAILIRRADVRPFSDTHLDLIRTFADQAVIAIENVRLFNETRESLERQTATAEILKVIASSPSDVQPVFDAILDNACKLCDSQLAAAFRFDGTLLHLVANRNWPAEALAKVASRYPAPPDPHSTVGRVALTGKAECQEDTLADPTYDHTTAHVGGWRRMLGVPLLREGVTIGVIVVTWREPGPIAERLVFLLRTFADQAVIAIENVRLFNETKEALERQTATGEILSSMSGSMTDAQPVFDAIARNLLRLFNSEFAIVTLVRDGKVEICGIEGARGFEKLRERYPVPLSDRTHVGKVILEARVSQLAPILGNPDSPPSTEQFARELGYNAQIGAPMIREGKAIGAIIAARRDAVPFDDKQVVLIKSFADQAVIAIENVRLFNETKESLERQTATAEILKVIASSPSDVQPVLDAIVQSAANLFECNSGILMLEGDKLYLRATGGSTATQEILSELQKLYPIPLNVDENVASRAIVDRTIVEVLDTEASDLPPGLSAISRVGRFRSVALAPLVREDAGIGVITLTFSEAGRKLNDKQLALLQTFADQAVIAIQNVRLFNETKEALEQQTATAEILQVISSSPTNTQPVFDAIVQSGLRLFPNASVAVVLPEGNKVRMAAVATQSPALAEAVRARFPIPLKPDRMHAKAILDGVLIDVPDAEAARNGPYAAGIENFLASGNRAITIAPMICDDTAIGAISVVRLVPGPLSEKQVALLRTFAAQAVIAIENVRVFKELEARTGALTRSVEQLTALGEVGQAISSTLDLETVLKTIVQRAVQLTGLDGGTIYEYDEPSEEFHLRAAENLSDEIVDLLRNTPMRKGEGVVGHAVETGEPTEIADMRDEGYQSPRRDSLLQAGYRALLVVPLRREEHIIGALAVNRKAPGHFSHEVVELLKTFATQSAMAIQNARLFREIAQKGKELEEASQHKSQFLASMSHELRTPLNAILGFNEMILGQVYGEVPADMQEPLTDIQTSGKHLLRLINNVLDLAKIEAGRMELSLQDYSVHDTVESVRATLRPLAVEKGLEFLVSIPNDLPLAYGDGGRITQCLMNLAGNALKFTKAGRVEIAVAAKGELLVYKVSDTGIGIPPDKIGSLFTEFKQTDATIASEYGGTGLGLSISKKFIEMHGGRIWVETELGKGSAFIFEVPLRVKTP